MTGWDAYAPRDGFCDELVRQVTVAPGETAGITLRELAIYTDGIRIVLTDSTPPPDLPDDRPFAEWELSDDLGTAYQRRRGRVSRNLRESPAHEHDVVFAPAVPASAERLELGDGRRVVTWHLEV